jgi:hypothetical protein
LPFKANPSGKRRFLPGNHDSLWGKKKPSRESESVTRIIENIQEILKA